MSHIGELHDLKFVEETSETEVPELVYAVSTDGVLSLFNVNTQEFVWKRQLTISGSGEEIFNLAYLSRNLLVYSQHRAMLLNTAGHFNFEVDFASLFNQDVATASGSKPVAAMFDHEGQLYSCFAHGNKAVLYKAAQYLMELPLDASLDVEDLSVDLMEMQYDSQTSQLYIFGKEAKTVRTYQLDMGTLSSNKIAQQDIGSSKAIHDFSSTSLTAGHVILHGAADSQVLETRSLKVIKGNVGQDIQSSPNDDLIVEGTAGSIVDLAQNINAQADLSGSDCSATRQRTTENWGNSNPSVSFVDLDLGVSCKNGFKIVTAIGATVYETSQLSQ